MAARATHTREFKRFEAAENKCTKGAGFMLDSLLLCNEESFDHAAVDSCSRLPKLVLLERAQGLKCAKLVQIAVR